MNSRVIVKLRMERSDKLVALSCSHDMPINNSKSLSVLLYPIDVGGTDERHRNSVANVLYRILRVEATKLTSVSITADVNVHCRDTIEIFTCNMLCKKDESGTSAKYRQPLLDVCHNRLKKTEIL